MVVDVVLFPVNVVEHVQVYSFLHDVKPRVKMATTARIENFFMIND